MTSAVVKYNLKCVFRVICDITETNCGVNLQFNVDQQSDGVWWGEVHCGSNGLKRTIHYLLIYFDRFQALSIIL